MVRHIQLALAKIVWTRNTTISPRAVHFQYVRSFGRSVILALTWRVLISMWWLVNRLKLCPWVCYDVMARSLFPGCRNRRYHVVSICTVIFPCWNIRLLSPLRFMRLIIVVPVTFISEHYLTICYECRWQKQLFLLCTLFSVLVMADITIPKDSMHVSVIWSLHSTFLLG